jgi:fructose-1,6-bisphosphatase/inositol monophosphatase family enzyme
MIGFNIASASHAMRCEGSSVPHHLTDAVGAVLRDAAERAITPRFRSLERSAVFEKSPGDWVTDADHEAEEIITGGLAALTPGVAVVGEEAAAADPSLVADGHLHDTVWVLDPLDGTKSFIGGSPDFATMCALIEDGEVTASWIWQPVHRRMYTAVRGAGAYADGVRLTRPTSPPGSPSQWRGVLRTAYMPHELRDQALVGFAASGLEHSDVSAAGIVYPMAAAGTLSHALYWRTLPWDHAPGSLLAQETGMTVARLDRSRYRPWDGRFGLLTAVDEGVWGTVREALPDGVDDFSTG